MKKNPCLPVGHMLRNREALQNTRVAPRMADLVKSAKGLKLMSVIIVKPFVPLKFTQY